jgi:hypothetical protein
MSRFAGLLWHFAGPALAALVLDESAWRGSFGARTQASPRRRVRGSQEWLASRASPFDSATIAVGADVARLGYSRPHARGRAVYDSLVPLGKAWRTGANEAPILALTAPAIMTGAALPAGRYAVLTVPEPNTWTVIFHSFTTPGLAFDHPVRVFASSRHCARSAAGRCAPGRSRRRWAGIGRGRRVGDRDPHPCTAAERAPRDRAA